jgi:hypothetical protein
MTAPKLEEEISKNFDGRNIEKYVLFFIKFVIIMKRREKI